MLPDRPLETRITARIAAIVTPASSSHARGFSIANHTVALRLAVTLHAYRVSREVAVTAVGDRLSARISEISSQCRQRGDSDSPDNSFHGNLLASKVRILPALALPPQYPADDKMLMLSLLHVFGGTGAAVK